VMGSCEHGNEPQNYIKGEGFLENLKDYHLLKKYVAQCRITDLICWVVSNA
jgi:hypothetical protein